MTKRLTRILCLIFVSAILISTISASDIITGTKAASPGEGTREPPTCYVQIIVSGEYIEHWDSGVMYMISFKPDDDQKELLTNVIYNHHNHPGTLTTWQLWDTGNRVNIETVSQFAYNRAYPNAKAKYYDYMVCGSEYY